MNELSTVDGLIFRAAEVAKDGVIDEEERLVRVSFSSEIRVLRQSWWDDPWIEILGHGEDEVNMERFENGASVHYNHSRSREDRVGVVESAEIKNDRGEAVVRFSKNARVDDVWEDVKDGILRNISVGYSIDQRMLTKESNTGEPDEYRITRWTPMELSFVDIPADPSVGVGREGMVDSLRTANYSIRTLSEETDSMKLKKLEGEADEAFVERQRLEDERVATEAATTAEASRQEGIVEGQRLEGVRTEAIRTVLAPFETQLGDGYIEFRDGFLNDPKKTVEEARSAVLQELGKIAKPTGSDAQVTETSAEKFVRAASVAVQLRAQLVDPKERESQLVIADQVRSYSLFEMARRVLELQGVSTGGLGKMDLVGRAFTTSDFPLILLDASNKSMLKGFEEAPETWQVWAQTGDLSDFKIGNRVNLSSFDDLVLVNENGEFKYGSFTEQGETIQLATYGKLFAISRQAIINDDLNAFTKIPSRMGRSASRVVGDLAYGQITTNPVMGDALALFSGTSIGTDHGNLNLDGAAILSAATLASMRIGMGRQTDASSSATGLNIRPAWLLVPLALEDSGKILMNAEFNPEEGTTTSFRAPNAVRNLAVVVSDPRLDVDSLTRYYLAAGQQFDTIEVAFLDGVQAPVLEQQAGWTVDGTEFKVRIDVGTAPMEFRTWQRNDGA